MSVRKLSGWAAGDGKEFAHENEAVAHDRYVDLRDALARNFDFDKERDGYAVALAEFITDNFDVIRKAG